MESIKKHFEEEALEYDGIIKNLIPYYSRMVEAVVNSMPFRVSDCIEVLDLGCGTGTVSRAVKNAYPHAKLTCLDISGKMLQMASEKLCEAPDTIFINSSFTEFDFDKKYDAVVSSLALHHLVTREDKLDFYKKIYLGLKSGWILINADLVLASDGILQNTYMEQWKNFMYRNVPADEVEKKWIPANHEEDSPASLTDHFEMLKEAGFTVMDVVWKYYNFAVCVAWKKT
jgi:tRNA (cmo5U34)-methyltransferase